MTTASLPRTRSAQPGASRRTAEATRALIVEAAQALFSERGYLGASIADIAELSGVGKSNILYFYANKDNLWKDTVEHVYRQVDEHLRMGEFIDVPPTWELLEAFLRRHILTCAQVPAYVKIPIIEGGQESWRTDWLAEHYLRRDIASFRHFLRPFVEAGMLPSGREFELQALLSGGAQIVFGQAPLFSKALRIEAIDEAFAGEYAKFVISLLKRAP